VGLGEAHALIFLFRDSRELGERVSESGCHLQPFFLSYPENFQIYSIAPAHPVLMYSDSRELFLTMSPIIGGRDIGEHDPEWPPRLHVAELELDHRALKHECGSGDKGSSQCQRMKFLIPIYRLQGQICTRRRLYRMTHFPTMPEL
jgi:hypothetical protein